MLDLLTLQKTRAGRVKGHDDLNIEGVLIESKAYQERIHTRHYLFDMIQELEEKIHAIEKEQEINPGENGIILVWETRTEKRYFCQTCHVEHSVYRIYFSQVHVRILRKIFAYCVSSRTHKIEKKNIPGLTHTDYGNFYALRRFGLLYWLEEDGKKIKGGNWGVPVGRIYDFLTWKWRVSEYSETDTATKMGKNSENRIYISEIPRYHDLERDNITGLPYFIEYEESKNLFPSYNI